MQINHISVYVKRLLEVMETGVTYTTNELMVLLDMKSRVSFRKKLFKWTFQIIQQIKIKLIIKID